MQTIKLYETDSYLSEFNATVISCEKVGKLYETVLDKTAFFPEGGGQSADKGTINNIEVLDVQIKDDVIVHMTKKPIDTGVADCRLDWKLRYSRMQNHSGEHLLSGIAHEMFGCTNVGFHMSNEITVDFDIELTPEQIEIIESKANEGIYKNASITAEFPSQEELNKLDYRSKLELTEDIRIVTIEGYDICACCAPHVSKTGEIGIIKILSSMRHRGGVRLQIICGYDAFKDYCIKTKNLHEIAVKLCAKHNHELEAFNKLCQENSDLKQKITAISSELISAKISSVTNFNGVSVYFENSDDMQYIRNLALESAKVYSGISAVFSGQNSNMKFAVASNDTSVKEIGAMLRETFLAKGGGSDDLIQGNITAAQQEIIDFLDKVKI